MPSQNNEEQEGAYGDFQTKEAQLYMRDTRVGDIAQYLCFAILKNRPADHVEFAKTWLKNLKSKMLANGTPSSAFGINLMSISGMKGKRFEQDQAFLPRDFHAPLIPPNTSQPGKASSGSYTVDSNANGTALPPSEVAQHVIQHPVLSMATVPIPSVIPLLMSSNSSSVHQVVSERMPGTEWSSDQFSLLPNMVPVQGPIIVTTDVRGDVARTPNGELDVAGSSNSHTSTAITVLKIMNQMNAEAQKQILVVADKLLKIQKKQMGSLSTFDGMMEKGKPRSAKTLKKSYGSFNVRASTDEADKFSGSSRTAGTGSINISSDQALTTSTTPILNFAEPTPTIASKRGDNKRSTNVTNNPLPVRKAEYHFARVESQNINSPLESSTRQEEGKGGKGGGEEVEKSGRNINFSDETEEEFTVASRQLNRRIAVSAAPVSHESIAKFEPPVIHKSESDMKQLVACLETSTLFSILSHEDCTVVAQAMSKEKFSSATAILTQGEATLDKFFLIVSGTVEIVKDQKVVCTIGRGQYFGELELMHDVPYCAATVKTVTAVEVYSLEKDTYQNLILSATLHRRAVFFALINQVDFFSASLDHYQKTVLAEALSSETFEAGTFIIRRGTVNQWMYIIMEGKVRVIGKDDSGNDIEIVQLGVGDVVGELEFLFHHDAVANVVAMTPLRVAKLGRKHFEMLMGPVTDLLKAFVASPFYEHYRKNANPAIIREIQHADVKSVHAHSRQAEQRMNVSFSEHPSVVGRSESPNTGDLSPTSQSLRVDGHLLSGLHEVDEAGEIVFGVQGGSDVVRFSLRPTEDDELCLCGLQEDGTILFWNETIARLTHFSADEVCGQSIFSLISHDSDQMLLHGLLKTARSWVGNWEAMEQAEDQYQREIITFANSDGLSKSHISLTILPPIVPSSGLTAEVFLVTGHSTKKKKPPMLDVGEWIRVSLFPKVDELVEVLQGKQTTSLKSSSPGSSPTKTMYASATSSLQDARKLATSLQSLVHQYEPLTQRELNSGMMDSLESVDVRVLLRRVHTELARELLAQGNKLIIHVDDNIPLDEIFLDTVRLSSMMIHLIQSSNALVRYGTITIDVSVPVYSPITPMPGVRGANFTDFKPEGGAKNNAGAPGLSQVLHISVHDDGPAMTLEALEVIEDYLPHVVGVHDVKQGKKMDSSSSFEPRVTILSKSKKYCAKMNGTMEVQSSSTSGNRVTLTLPLLINQGTAASTLDSLADKSGSDAATAPSQDALTVVLVESEPVHRNMLCSYLWSRKHAVLPASSWQEVVKHINSGNCDILIVDPDVVGDQHSHGHHHHHHQHHTRSTTPPTDGSEKFPSVSTDPMQVLMEHSKEIAIIVLSEDFDQSTAESYEKFQGLLVLPKPCSVLQIHHVIRKAEEDVMRMRENKHRIAQLRQTFSKTNRSKLEIGDIIGRGSFGEVRTATDVLTGGKMAMKALRVADEDKDQLDQLAGEIDAMATLQHENIIHYFYCERTSETKMNIFMELAAGGTLGDMIRKRNGPLTHPEIVLILTDILNGICYIHDHKFLHSDIKSENIFIKGATKDRKLDMCKIGDFGTAKQLATGQKLYVMRGTPAYMAPEVINVDEAEGIGFDLKADIWSLGCIVMEMATGKPPWYYEQQHGGPMALINYLSGLKDTPPNLEPLFNLHPALFHFIRACLESNPDKRPTAKELQHYSLLTEKLSSSHNKEAGHDGEAVKLLNRAKFLHVLNNYVAFSAEKGKDSTNESFESPFGGHVDLLAPKGPERSRNTSSFDDESSFFASSSDEEEVVQKPVKAGGGRMVNLFVQKLKNAPKVKEGRKRQFSPHPET